MGPTNDGANGVEIPARSSLKKKRNWTFSGRSPFDLKSFTSDEVGGGVGLSDRVLEGGKSSGDERRGDGDDGLGETHLVELGSR